MYAAVCGCAAIEPPRSHVALRQPPPRLAVPRGVFFRSIRIHLVASGHRLGDLAGKESIGRPSSDGSKHQSPYTDLEQCHSWRVGFNAGLNSPVCSCRSGRSSVLLDSTHRHSTNLCMRKFPLKVNAKNVHMYIYTTSHYVHGEDTKSKKKRPNELLPIRDWKV